MGAELAAVGAPRTLVFSCGVAAASAGLIQLHLAGAPPQYLTVNLAGLGIGLLLVALLNGPMVRCPEPVAAVLCAAGAILLTATSLWGSEFENVRRWMAAGPVVLQTSLIVIPAMLVLYARFPGRLATASLSLAALALAAQPDPAMAAALAAGLLVILISTVRQQVLLALLFALVGSVAALYQPHALPAIEHVEGVYGEALRDGWVRPVLVYGGTVLLLCPALLALRRDPVARRQYAAFGACWLVIVGAAAVGNYPTPVVGHGASAIIGYLLCGVALAGAPARTAGPDFNPAGCRRASPQ